MSWQKKKIPPFFPTASWLVKLRMNSSKEADIPVCTCRRGRTVGEFSKLKKLWVCFQAASTIQRWGFSLPAAKLDHPKIRIQPCGLARTEACLPKAAVSLNVETFWQARSYLTCSFGPGSIWSNYIGRAFKSSPCKFGWRNYSLPRCLKINSCSNNAAVCEKRPYSRQRVIWHSLAFVPPNSSFTEKELHKAEMKASRYRGKKEKKKQLGMAKSVIGSIPHKRCLLSTPDSKLIIKKSL